MNSLRLLPDCVAPTAENIAHLESQVRRRVGNRIRNLSIYWHDDGWLLEGATVTYHAKQLAQEAVMDNTPLPLRANRIRVEPRTSNLRPFLLVKGEVSYVQRHHPAEKEAYQINGG